MTEDEAASSTEQSESTSVDDQNDAYPVLQNESMRLEHTRLDTFRDKWPTEVQISADKLAAAGFYYIGLHNSELDSDLVQCFACGVTHRGWQVNDEAWHVHSVLNADCVFVKDPFHCGNVFLQPAPLSYRQSRSSGSTGASVSSGRQSTHTNGEDMSNMMMHMDRPAQTYADPEIESDPAVQMHMITSDSAEVRRRQLQDSVELRLDTFREHHWPKESIVTAESLAAAAFYYQGDNDCVRCAFCDMLAHDWKVNDDPLTVHTRFHANCVFVRTLRRRNRSRYTSHRARLRSFTDWPKPHICTAQQLASAGFYYEQNADSVVCAYCKNRLHDWRAGDDPWTEHCTHFPDCAFVRHHRATDRAGSSRQPIDHELHSNSSDSDSDGDLELMNATESLGLGEDTAGFGGLTHLQDNWQGPSHYAQLASTNSCPLVSVESEQRRRLNKLGVCVSQAQRHDLSTYSSRHQTYSGQWPVKCTQTPEQLAMAGFYYTGQADRVRCFYCDGGVHKWLPTDSPFTEHARWFPHCDYVRLCKGADFVESVLAGRAVHENSTEVSPIKDVDKDESTLLSLVARGVDVNQPTIRAALDQGYQPSLIVQALTTNKFLVPASSALFIKQLDTLKIDRKSTQQKKTDVKKSEAESSRELSEQRTCKICMDAEVCIVLLPCGHLCCCAQCAPALRHCPICRKDIHGLVRAYMA